ncbi:LuxR family transcriptional regulator [Paenibacillaceae bacterium]|nr:LuxR family transcriptional regulator [Paenibacillaceae bacterium]
MHTQWAGGASSASFPTLFAAPDHFKQVCEQNKALITIFSKRIASIKNYLTGTFLFLLTDARGALLAMDYSNNLEQTIRNSPIRLGMYFTEQSCGINAISRAMSTRGSVYLNPEQHENPIFKTWHCFSTPITASGTNIGYLDVSTIDGHMRSELIAIAKLLPELLMNYAVKETDQQPKSSRAVQLTDRQLLVLKLIAQGNTIKSIASKLKIKECTVNHHKKVIFDKFGVQSSAEAVSKASRMFFW